MSVTGNKRRIGRYAGSHAKAASREYGTSVTEIIELISTESVETAAALLNVSSEAVFKLRRDHGLADNIVTRGTRALIDNGHRYLAHKCAKCSSRLRAESNPKRGGRITVFSHCTACARASHTRAARGKDPHSKPMLPPEYRHKLNEIKEPDYWDSLEND